MAPPTARQSILYSHALSATAAANAALCVALVSARIRNKRRDKRARLTLRSSFNPLPPTVQRSRLANPSPWKHLFSCGTSSDLILSVNFPRHVILDHLLPLFDEQRQRVNYGSPYRKGPKMRGRPPALESIDILGLVLCYLKSSCNQNQLCRPFGIAQTSVGVWIEYGMQVLHRIVSHTANTQFRVEWPTPQQITESNAVLSQQLPANDPALHGVFAVCAITRLPICEQSTIELPSAFPEDSPSTEKVSNFFVFDFHGEIIHAVVNNPVSRLNDRLVLEPEFFYDKLEDAQTPPGFSVLADFAFAPDSCAIDQKVAWGGTACKPLSVSRAMHDAAINVARKSERPAAEADGASDWVMEHLKGVFGRMHRSLSPSSESRQRLLSVIVHLFNFRLRSVGASEIAAAVNASQEAGTRPWLSQFTEVEVGQSATPGASDSRNPG